MSSDKIQKRRPLPVVALRDVVIFPGSRQYLFVGRSLSLAALKHAGEFGDRLVFVTQRDERTERPGQDELYRVGCLARLEEVANADDSNAKRVVVTGLERVWLDAVHLDRPRGMQMCRYQAFPSDGHPGRQETASWLAKLRKAIRSAKGSDSDVVKRLMSELEQSSGEAGSGKTPSLALWVDLLSSNLGLGVAQQQELLEQTSVMQRARMLLGHISAENAIAKIERQLRMNASVRNRRHRQDYLKEKAASIQRELGEGGIEDVEALRRRVADSGMHEDARNKCLLEINRLTSMTPLSPEATVIRNYVDCLLDLPWTERSQLSEDLVRARRILDEDHKGLDKVKDRIIEYLAVQQRVGHSRGTVMCFLGPPGVGKTSLGKSIARATGRQIVSLALGGVHDEATIRGHRRTYVASMPGRILKAMADARVRNPVFMLDELDKLGTSMSGDPMAAMLEVIDPEQNSRFVDQYAEVEYDLSEVMFIGTANSSSTMSGALRDRLEIIKLPGYTDMEKCEIADRHLVPKQLEANGIAADGLRFPDKVLNMLVRDYTKEAGVRDLERLIAKISRKIVLEQDLGKPAAKSARDAPKRVALTAKRVRGMLEAPLTFSALRRSDKIGIVNGLAVVNDWEGIVHQIDALRLPGKGVKKTGNIKENIQQSIDAALTILRASPGKYGLAADFLDSEMVHIHYPNIDIIHDGDSNGLALFTLLVSVLNDIPVRVDTAMTGAVNLRGEACAIGGLRTKLVGAWRERIKRVLIPQIQARELGDLPAEIAAQIEVVPVRNVDECISNALTRMPERKPARQLGALLQSPGRIADTSACH